MDEAIIEQLKELPEILMNHIISAALDENIEEILKDHPLQNVQKEAYKLEVMLVLTRLASIEEFTVNIKHNMEIAMKRAEVISTKTKQLIFLPVQDMLVQRATVVDEEEGMVGDGVAAPEHLVPPTPPVAPTTLNKIHHEIPLQDIEKRMHPEVKDEHPLVAEAPKEVVPTAKEKVLQKPEVEGAIPKSNIFAKRLETPVHTPVEENKLGENGEKIANTAPSSQEQIAADPYKESIE